MPKYRVSLKDELGSVDEVLQRMGYGGRVGSGAYHFRRGSICFAIITPG